MAGLVQQRNVDDGERRLLDAARRRAGRRRWRDRPPGGRSPRDRGARRYRRTRSARASRDRPRRRPSSTSAPNRAAIAARRLGAGAITPCASSSASRHGTPRRRSASSTWLLPVAMPPVSATFSMRIADAAERQAARTGPPTALQPRCAVSVFLSSIAIVSGPTPPGTGVSAPATSATAGCTSPTTSAPRRSNASRRFEPGGNSRSTVAAIVDPRRADVDDRRAGLDELRRHERRPADRRHEDVGLARQPAARSAVREWQIVTVACRCSSSSAIGLPTMSLRPMTTACAPAIAISDRSSSSMTPDGVHGDERRAVLHQPADVDRMEAVDVLVGPTRRRRPAARRPVPCASGSGDCTRMPSCASLAIQRVDDREQLGERRRRRQPLEVGAQPGSRRPTSACCAT